MASWEDLERWNVQGMRAVGDDLGERLRKLRATESELRDAATPREWDGDGAAAARKSLAGIEQGLQNRVAEFSALQRAVDDAADRIEQGIERAIREVKDLATAHEYKIVRGEVFAQFDHEDTDPGSELDRTRAQVKGLQEQQIEQVLRAALDIDVDLTMVMLSIADGKIDDDGAETMAQAATSGSKFGAFTALEPPEKATPSENKAWWNTLSDAERSWLIRNKPDLIGNRKGLPYADRGKANEIRIGEARKDLEARRKELVENPPRRFTGNVETIDRVKLNRELNEIDGKLKALDALDDQADQGNTIMSFDPSGGRVLASVGIGDVDTAEKVAFYTPGTHADVGENMERYVKEATEVNGYAQKMLIDDPATHGEKSAMVVNMDYDAPQNLATEATRQGQAEAGAKRLVAEMEGLQTSRGDTPPDRVTAIGHSYGSVTTALALRETDAADAFVRQGSPGDGTGGFAARTAIRVSDDESYNLASKDDNVPKTGWHGGNPSLDSDVRQLSTQSEVSRDGEHLHATSEHTDYHTADAPEGDRKASSSEYNTAAVIAGKQELIIEKPAPPPKEPIDWTRKPG